MRAAGPCSHCCLRDDHVPPNVQVEKGSTAAVFGLGTIGLSVVDALRDAQASRIIGVDTDPGKYERARKWGATDIVNPKDHKKPIQVKLLACLQLHVAA